MTHLKSSLSAVCLSFMMSVSAHAATLQEWTRDVESRVDSALHASSDLNVRKPESGIVRMKLLVSPDGTIVQAETVGPATSVQRSAGRRVAARLGQLPPLPGARGDTPVSLLLGFGTSAADSPAILRQLAKARAESRFTLASR
jgi:hypothetical protein